MSTQEIADRFVELCRKQEWQQIYSELYSNEAESVEPSGTPWPAAKGMDAIAKKGEQWQGMVEEAHGMEISEPLVASDYFTVRMVSDNTMKGMGRVKFEELSMYQIQDGKIVKEQFFYTPPPQP